MTDKKIKTGISISEALLTECDQFSVLHGFLSRSELIETSLSYYMAMKSIENKTAVLVPELAEEIAQASDSGITKISKGLFRYAVELEIIIRILSEITECPPEAIEEYRREAVNNVRRTRGKINLEDLISRNSREEITE